MGGKTAQGGERRGVDRNKDARAKGESRAEEELAPLGSWIVARGKDAMWRWTGMAYPLTYYTTSIDDQLKIRITGRWSSRNTSLKFYRHTDQPSQPAVIYHVRLRGDYQNPKLANWTKLDDRNRREQLLIPSHKIGWERTVSRGNFLSPNSAPSSALLKSNFRCIGSRSLLPGGKTHDGIFWRGKITGEYYSLEIKYTVLLTHYETRLHHSTRMDHNRFSIV